MFIKKIIVLSSVFYILVNGIQVKAQESIIESITNISKENIIRNEQNIEEDINKKLNDLYRTIDISIDSLFSPLEANVDKYLDFHYSVYGEYAELTTAMFGDLEQEIQEKLLGKNFDKQYKNISDVIENQYTNEIKQHFIDIDRYASEGIDMELNADIFDPVMTAIQNNKHIQQIKISTVAGVAIGAKIASVIAAKALLKATGKTALKTGTKAAAAATGATLGLGCGPAAPICSLALATAAWFGTDAVVVTGDELLNRDELKNKILLTLDELKKELKDSYKDSYKEKFTKTSEEIRNAYKNTPQTIKKRKEEDERARRIKDIF